MIVRQYCDQLIHRPISTRSSRNSLIDVDFVAANYFISHRFPVVSNAAESSKIRDTN